MFNSKYSSFLSMLLVILIVAIVGVLGYFAYDMYNQHDKNTKAQAAIEEFDKATQSVRREFANSTKNEVVNEPAGNITNPLENLNTTSAQANTAQENNTQTKVEKTYQEGYEVLGTISIPKTKCNYTVLNQVTKRSIEIEVAVLYPTNLTALNLPGNTVIVGHNYRNDLFFSRNNELEIGDEVIIKSATETVTYEIYNIYETSSDDADYMQRDTNGGREISLSTCTDASTERRLIIWAKEKV